MIRNSMKFSRDDIYNMCNDNNLKTIDELMEYIDFENFKIWVDYDFDWFRCTAQNVANTSTADMQEAYSNIKESKYSDFIEDGAVLNKDKCMNYITTDKYFRKLLGIGIYVNEGLEILQELSNEEVNNE
jgi:hypothetical protein